MCIRDRLEDTASNIMAYINKWIAKKTKATRNAMILKVLKMCIRDRYCTVVYVHVQCTGIALRST